MDRVTIEALNLAFAYDAKPVLRNVSLRVEAGELFTVLGPSGSGKTTLLRLLAGLERASQGSLKINGIEVQDNPPAGRAVGMVFQNFALWPHMSVFDNVAFALDERAGQAGKIKERVEAMLDLLEIAHKRDARPDHLSLGQQQRVALARALVTEPRMLLLDDPFSNLESELRLQMRRDLRRLQRRLGITTILVTHDQDDALSISDRVALLADGVVQQIGTPAAIYDFPATVAVARFVGVTNFLAGQLRRIDSSTIEFDSPYIGRHVWPATRQAKTDGPVVLSVRPHALRIQPVDSFRDGRYAWLEGRIQTSEFLGESVRYQVEVGGIMLSVNQPHFTGAQVLPYGTAILVGFEPSQARLFADPGADLLPVEFAPVSPVTSA